MKERRKVMVNETEWILCPICGGKTRDKIRKDTIMKSYPVFCPKCKKEILIDVENFNITEIHKPAAKPQSQ